MLMRRFFCDVIPKHSMDENEIRTVEAWVPDNGDYYEIVEDIRQLAWEFGYELVDSDDVEGCDEYVDFEQDCLEDRFCFVEDEDF